MFFLVWTTISDLMLLFFYDKTLSLSHTQTPPHTTYPGLAGNLDYVQESQLDCCVYVCVFLLGVWEGVGRWAGASSDWPTDMGDRQNADWIDVCSLACRFLCAM